jgi:hypothetical protein
VTATLWIGETRSSPLPDPEKSWHNTMALIDSPWSRLRNPAPIPTGFTARTLIDLDDLGFAQLIQAHLVPRDQDPQGRRLWERFWRVLREDDRLADRTYDVLEQFLSTTEAAIEDGNLDDAGTKRAEKFTQQCEMSWQRVNRGRDRDGALGWAGQHATAHPPQSRRVIASLIAAIARHRADVLREFGKPTASDAELWDVMARLGLDPRDYDTRDR